MILSLTKTVLMVLFSTLEEQMYLYTNFFLKSICLIQISFLRVVYKTKARRIILPYFLEYHKLQNKTRTLFGKGRMGGRGGIFPVVVEC